MGFVAKVWRAVLSPLLFAGLMLIFLSVWLGRGTSAAYRFIDEMDGVTLI